MYDRIFNGRFEGKGREHEQRIFLYIYSSLLKKFSHFWIKKEPSLLFQKSAAVATWNIPIINSSEQDEPVVQILFFGESMKYAACQGQPTSQPASQSHKAQELLPE